MKDKISNWYILRVPGDLTQISHRPFARHYIFQVRAQQFEVIERAPVEEILHLVRKRMDALYATLLVGTDYAAQEELAKLMQFFAFQMLRLPKQKDLAQGGDK